jgi:hypothetical protein
MMDLARRLRTGAVLALLAAVPLTVPPGAYADGTAADTVTLELRKNGVLHVKDEITGGPVTRTLLTRTRYDDANDRLFQITNVTGGTFDGTTLTASGTVEYDVTGAVTPIDQGEELRWFLPGPAAKITVTVTGPAQVQNLSCFAGELTAAVGCTTAAMDETASAAQFEQQDLGDGQALTVVVGYPAGATGARPVLAHRFELAGAFTVNAITGGALALLLVLLLGGFGLVYWTRGRDARVVTAEGGPAASGNGYVQPPDGVRPGQIGTLLDEQADVIDVTATILDLAVRGYLRIDEQPRQAYEAPDWMLAKLPNAPVGGLLPYEKALHDAIFDGRDSVRLSQLRGGFTAALGRVRDALYRDVVSQGWFARRPDAVRSRWTTIGLVVTALGVAATVVLAWLTTYGLLGLALVIAGAALIVGGQYMPAKTASGAAALAHMLGFREHLSAGEIGEVPTAQRIETFSRYLPYAVVFDSVDRWARVVASIRSDGSGNGDNLYWYHGPAEWDLSRFADSMRTFTLTTSGALSAARVFRSL